MTFADALNYGWRNYISNLMGLDPKTFQLAQGTLGLQTSDSSGLFLMADAVPPESAVNYYDATSTNKRSSAYLGLLSALLPETNPNALSAALGDQYAAWIVWKLANRPNPGENYLAYFERWGTSINVDPGRLSRGTEAIVNAQNSPLLKAYAAYDSPMGWQSFVNPSSGVYTLPIYQATHDAAVSAIANGGSLNLPGNARVRPMAAETSGLRVRFDSGAMVSEVEGLPPLPLLAAAARVAGANKIAAFEAPLPRAATAPRVTVTGRIGSYATVASGPGAWYSSNEVSRAYTGNGNSAIWDAGAASGDWNSFFGAAGSLARYVSQLVLVSNYELTVTVSGQDSQSAAASLTPTESSGSWPLFSSSGPPTQDISPAQTRDNSITVVHTLAAGKIQIWGVTVQPAP